MNDAGSGERLAMKEARILQKRSGGQVYKTEVGQEEDWQES